MRDRLKMADFPTFKGSRTYGQKFETHFIRSTLYVDAEEST